MLKILIVIKRVEDSQDGLSKDVWISYNDVLRYTEGKCLLLSLQLDSMQTVKSHSWLRSRAVESIHKTSTSACIQNGF